MSKLNLGTVQFGIPYGINNITGLPSQHELVEIFTLAKISGIEMLDTAPSYGDAEEKIGSYSNDNFKVITKFSNVKSEDEINLSFSNSLGKLNVNKIYGYIAHNADHLITIPELWNSLVKLKDAGKVDKIGYSLYTVEQLENLLEIGMSPDLIQLPYSLLDRKFEQYFNQLKSIGIEIHVRSVFLQGLYFLSKSKIPSKLLSLEPAIQEINNLCKESDITINSLALNFAMDNHFIDKVVIGVDSVNQLSDNLHTINTWIPIPGLYDAICQIKIPHPELLNPANW